MAAVVVSAACKKNETTAPTGASPSASVGEAPSGSTSAPELAAGIPVAAASVSAAINPKGAKAYEGPFGSVAGVIHVKGDPPPAVPDLFIPRACPEAKEMYSKLFRVGPGNTLPDAIVGVTDYDAFVPSLAEARQVKIKGCAFDARTITMTFGERLEVVNVSDSAYLPVLVGARMPALMVALPHGDAVRLYPQLPGRYSLKDSLMHPWMNADVAVLKYATHAVSDGDGKYRIDRVPVGRVKVSVVHPSIPHVLIREVEVKADQIATSDFEVPFDAKKDTPPSLSAAASASAAPSGPKRPPEPK